MDEKRLYDIECDFELSIYCYKDSDGCAQAVRELVAEVRRCWAENAALRRDIANVWRVPDIREWLVNGGFVRDDNCTSGEKDGEG